jgi:hypothetical protein
MKRVVFAILCLVAAVGLYAYHYVGLILSEGINRSLNIAHVPFAESTDLSAKLALPGAVIFLGGGLWLLLGPLIRKMLSAMRRGRRNG